MSTEENDKLKEHLDDIKKYDSDLYVEQEEIENELNAAKHLSRNYKKNTSPTISKGIIIFIAIFMFISAIGTLTNVLNIPVVEFLKKSQQLSKDPMIQAYKEAIVTVKADNRKGTGFNISARGYIVTNYHIVLEEKESVVSFSDGSVYIATVIESYPTKDLALLSLERESDQPLPYFKIEPQKNWKKNDPVYFVGNPLSFNFIANEGTVVGETENNNLDIPALLIHAPVYSGNSGSPVINSNGDVIAMIYAKGSTTIANKSKNVGYAIPIYSIQNILKKHMNSQQFSNQEEKIDTN